ncbi:hypothetical protein B0J14DRAFT_638659 [Halenospora varia]|nr:hypothetical protein B0J14DRAFT_638659 [Halenospora varia]
MPPFQEHPRLWSSGQREINLHLRHLGRAQKNPQQDAEQDATQREQPHDGNILIQPALYCKRALIRYGMGQSSYITVPAHNLGSQMNSPYPAGTHQPHQQYGSPLALHQNGHSFARSTSSALIAASTMRLHALSLPMHLKPAPSTFKTSDKKQEMNGTLPPGRVPLKKRNFDQRGNNLHHLAGLPDHENCALFMTNIPAHATYGDIFDQIHVGAVASLHLQKPNGNHTTSAVFLVFKTAEAARRMLFANTIILGQRVTIRYNREGHRATPGSQTRVLKILAPEELGSAYFYAYFDEHCDFTWEKVLKHDSATPGLHTLELRFVRIEGQSRMCLKQIHEDEEMKLKVVADYGADPCGLGYEIAV